VAPNLFAMAATCSRAQRLYTRDRAAGGGRVKLADLFCRQARRRVRSKFTGYVGNEDVPTFKFAQEILAGEHRWLERRNRRTARIGARRFGEVDSSPVITSHFKKAATIVIRAERAEPRVAKDPPPSRLTALRMTSRRPSVNEKKRREEKRNKERS